VIFADAAEAEEMVRGELPPESLLPADSGGAVAPKKGKRGLAGSGTLDFAFTDWFTGNAKVVFGPTGHLTVIGKIAPPKQIELMKPKTKEQTLLPTFRIEACYGIPRLADVHVGIGVGLSAYGSLGPIYMTDLALDGVYSTDPKVLNKFAITGTVRAQAEAGLKLALQGYAGLSLLGHSVNFGAEVWGKAGIQAYAEARTTLGYREKAAPAAGKKGEYYLQGHLEMAAQPILAFGGDLFVEVNGWLYENRWKWPMGSVQYPLPGQLGIGADIDYVIGSGKLPDVNFTKPSFDASKFVSEVMNNKLPAKGAGAGKKETAGKFDSKTPTKPTQSTSALPKKGEAKSEITGGASKTQRTTGQQTPDEKKKAGVKSKAITEAEKTGKKADGKKGADANEKGKDKKGDKDKAVGARITFQVNGETHTQYIDNGVPMVASTPTSVKSKIEEWRPRLRELSDADQKKAGELIGTAIAIEKKVAGLVTEAKADKSKEAALEAKQRELAAQLAKLWKIMAPNGESNSQGNQGSKDWEKPAGWRLPKDGEWVGTVGNSPFKPSNPGKVGLQSGNVIQYHEGMPDFSPWKYGQNFEVQRMTGHHADDMPLIWEKVAQLYNLPSNNAARNWLSSKQLTPHHVNGNTIQLIPRKLHSGIRHTGGAFELREDDQNDES
jgi:hypothetical protein